MAEQKEGFEVLAELTNRYWRTLQIHADTAAAVGPGALMPAVTLPQAQLDLQQAVREAFYAGAAFQAALQPITVSVDHGAIFDADTAGNPRVLIERIPTLQASLNLGTPAQQEERHLAEAIAWPRARLDLAAMLPQRGPNPYEEAFADEGLKLWCTTCHQAVPLPSPARVGDGG